MDTHGSHDPLVEVAPLGSDNRYRLVRFKGHDWEPVDRQEFRAEAARLFPGLDLEDSEQVEWQDHPWEWPNWHPGEA
ncbi:hypothetical protein OG500_32200 [Kitasatospora sp. NBC_01250]|uniref:hypothetical protein n=1 Tax=unclassified Kitasatospora TaxID=2633591 RepID=UPI002E15D74C|nr:MULTISPECIES: hypothetical protein [unclassified Kitasatospora]WSJ70654.1 hypothetical protein OG294_33730 [Kitasatospora sp. NBC_01302]